MATLPFLLAIWALLLTPGPTNTLMALSGAQAGWRPSLRLIPVELAAYLIVILPVALFGVEAIAGWPWLARAIKLGAAGWIFCLAIGLWHRPDEHGRSAQVGVRQLFVTTLLNPKALIVGLILLPPPATALFAPRLTLFAGSMILAAMVWAALGAQLSGRGTAGDPLWLRRTAASWLALLSAGLVMGVVPR